MLKNLTQGIFMITFCIFIQRLVVFFKTTNQLQIIKF